MFIGIEIIKKTQLCSIFNLQFRRVQDNILHLVTGWWQQWWWRRWQRWWQWWQQRWWRRQWRQWCYIANKFNYFFTNIGINFSQQITAPNNKSFKDYLTPRHGHIFQLKNINEESVNHIIDKLATKTNFGFNGLSSIFLWASNQNKKFKLNVIFSRQNVKRLK